MLVDDPAWAEIRRLYIETDVPVRELAERFGLGERAVFARRKAEQWPARSARAAKPQARKRGPKQGARAPASRSEPRHRALIRRLYTALDLRLQLMEKRMRDGEVLPPAEEEREARGLNSLVRSLEKALQIDPDPEKPRAGGAGFA